MKKLFYAIILLLIVPVVVNAKTVTCTTKTNFVVGEDPYKGLSVTCSDGTDSLTCSKSDGGECVKNENFKLQLFSVWGSNASEANYHNMTDEPVLAGETDSLLFSLTYKFESGDKLVIDGKDESNMMMGCDFGCILSGAERSPKANSNSGTSTTPTTPTKPDPTPTEPVHVNVYWVEFDVNGGKEKIDSQAVEEGKTATKPVDPTRDGYIFKEWQLNGKKYDFSSKIKKTIKLKAIWDEDASGKENISFVKITGLLAPYEGDTLDNDFRIETTKAWNTSLFRAEIEWYRGKDNNKIDERVLKYQDHKAEAGYYYQVKFILTPGDGYTLNKTKAYLGGKKVTTSKEDSSLVFYSPVYGPLEKGVSADPLIVIEDYEGTFYSGKMNETEYHVPYLLREHDNDAEKILLGPNCMSVSNTTYFKIDNNLCGTDEIKTDFTAIDARPINLTFKGGNFQAGQVISTDIIITDVNGKEYRGTWSFKVIKPEPVKVGKEGDPIIAEFLAEAGKNWVVRAESLTNFDMGHQVFAEIPVSGFTFVSLQNITVFNEDGEEQRDGTFTIKIWLDEEMRKYKDFKFVYVYGGEGYKMGTGPEEITGHVEGEYLVAKLPHLSNYAIYGADETKNETKKNISKENNNNIILYSSIGAALVVIGVVTFILIKKKNK